MACGPASLVARVAPRNSRNSVPAMVDVGYRTKSVPARMTKRRKASKRERAWRW